MAQAVAIDFETYYDNECSVKGATARNYARHPKFDAFLVAIYAPNEFTFVGKPSDFDWTQLDGRDIVAHNASFEEAVITQLIADEIIPKFDYRIFCTADMCVYLQYPRSLKGAIYAHFNEELSKDVRDNLKGKNWDDILADGTRNEVLRYALDDAMWCWRLWDELNGQWNTKERELSALTRKMGYEGVSVDIPALEQGIDALKKTVFDSETSIPWTQEHDPKYKSNYPPTSVRGLAVTCAKHGIDPPKSTAENSEERLAWEEEYGERFPWIQHMGNFRKANKHLKTLETMEGRLIDGRMPYGLKYYGAEATGRWSGDSGFNTQNMPREANFGVNIRNLIVPKEGHSFVICDLSQIEPRCLAYLCGDTDFLEQVGKGVSPYEVHARLSMGFNGTSLKKEDPDMYLLAKVRVLSLGYGASFQSFMQSASAYGASHVLQSEVTQQQEEDFIKVLRKRDKVVGADYLDWWDRMTALERKEAVNAWLQVEDFRNSNPKIRDLWRKFDKLLKTASSEKRHNSTLVYELPCGRHMRYFNITPSGYSFKCFTQRKDSPQYNRFRYMYGSRMVENACQAMARSVFSECLLEIQKRGHKIVLQVHDEVVIETPTDSAETVAKEVESIMSQSPKWAESLPVSAESQIVTSYRK